MTLNLFTKKVSLKTKIGYIVDVLLLADMLYIIVSGILISKVIFPNLNPGNNMIFKSTHISTAYAALLLVGIHLGLHWDWVMNTFKRIFRITHTNNLWRFASNAAVIIVLLFGAYNLGIIAVFTALTFYIEKLLVGSRTSVNSLIAN